MAMVLTASRWIALLLIVAAFMLLSHSHSQYHSHATSNDQDQTKWEWEFLTSTNFPFQFHLKISKRPLKISYYSICTYAEEYIFQPSKVLNQLANSTQNKNPNPTQKRGGGELLMLRSGPVRRHLCLGSGAMGTPSAPHNRVVLSRRQHQWHPYHRRPQVRRRRPCRLDRVAHLCPVDPQDHVGPGWPVVLVQGGGVGGGRGHSRPVMGGLSNRQAGDVDASAVMDAGSGPSRELLRMMERWLWIVIESDGDLWRLWCRWLAVMVVSDGWF